MNTNDFKKMFAQGKSVEDIQRELSEQLIKAGEEYQEELAAKKREEELKASKTADANKVMAAFSEFAAKHYPNLKLTFNGKPIDGKALIALLDGRDWKFLSWPFNYFDF